MADLVLSVDETVCGLQCQHPSCWASHWRLDQGIPKILPPLHRVTHLMTEAQSSGTSLPAQSIYNLLQDFGGSVSTHDHHRYSASWQGHHGTHDLPHRSRKENSTGNKPGHQLKLACGGPVRSTCTGLHCVEAHVSSGQDLPADVWNEELVYRRFYVWVPRTHPAPQQQTDCSKEVKPAVITTNVIGNRVSLSRRQTRHRKNLKRWNQIWSHRLQMSGREKLNQAPQDNPQLEISKCSSNIKVLLSRPRTAHSPGLQEFIPTDSHDNNPRLAPQNSSRLAARKEKDLGKINLAGPKSQSESGQAVVTSNCRHCPDVKVTKVTLALPELASSVSTRPFVYKKQVLDLSLGPVSSGAATSLPESADLDKYTVATRVLEQSAVTATNNTESVTTTLLEKPNGFHVVLPAESPTRGGCGPLGSTSASIKSTCAPAVAATPHECPATRSKSEAGVGSDTNQLTSKLIADFPMPPPPSPEPKA